MDKKEGINHLSDSSGFVAALDQSGGSTPKTLRNYGIDSGRYSGEEEMMALMHAMRIRIVTSPAFNGQFIVGAILFERTMDSRVEGMLTADYLWQKRRVLPFLKIDAGLADTESGTALMKPIPDIDARLEHACARNIFGTKMRSVIYDTDRAGVERIVDQQFEFADRILGHGLVPIVEPEVSIDCPKKAECEDWLLESLSDHLDALPESRKVALKLTLPETPGHYSALISHPNVIRVTALSGGYSREEACRRLVRNQGMIASFSRALAEGLTESMSDAEFHDALGHSVAAIYAASVS